MNYTFFCYWYIVKFLETLPWCQGHLCDKGLLSKWHHTPYRDVRPVQGLWLSQLTGSFSSSVVTFHWPFQSATLKRLLRMWECEQSEQVANTQILRPNVCLLPARRVCLDTVPGVCVIGQRSKLTLRDVHPWILTHTWILKYLLNVITGLSDVSGDVIFICFLFSLQLLTAVHPFLSNHCFTVFLQLSVSLSPHIQLPPAFSHFPPPLHSCLFPHISFQPGSTQVQKHNPRFSACVVEVHSLLEWVQSSLQALRFCHLIFVLLWPKCPKWVPLWEFPLGSGCINLVSGRKESGSPLPLLLPPLASDCD